MWHMAGYTIISDVSDALVKILRDNLVPDVIQSMDGIGLCSPAEKGDFALGLYLYDIRENEDIFASGMQMAGQNEQRFPPKYINLFFMITAYSMSDLKYRASEEQRILGRVIQVLMDHGTLDPAIIGKSGGNDRYPIRLEMLRLDNDEKMKLWNIPNEPYKLSLYYKVSPIEIESTRVKNVSRVRQVDLNVKEIPQMDGRN